MGEPVMSFGEFLSQTEVHDIHIPVIVKVGLMVPIEIGSVPMAESQKFRDNLAGLFEAAAALLRSPEANE